MGFALLFVWFCFGLCCLVVFGFGGLLYVLFVWFIWLLVCFVWLRCWFGCFYIVCVVISWVVCMWSWLCLVVVNIVCVCWLVVCRVQLVISVLSGVVSSLFFGFVFSVLLDCYVCLFMFVLGCLIWLFCGYDVACVQVFVGLFGVYLAYFVDVFVLLNLCFGSLCCYYFASLIVVVCLLVLCCVWGLVVFDLILCGCLVVFMIIMLVC